MAKNAPCIAGLPIVLAELHPLARRLAGDDADDLIQSTLLAVVETSARPTGSVRAWLSGVMRKVRWKGQRKERRRREREHVLSLQRQIGPYAEEKQRDTLEELCAALGRLEPSDRELVRACYVEGRTSVELAEQLEINESTVRTRLSRACAQLRANVCAVCGVACFAPWAEAAVGASVGAASVAAATAMKLGVGLAAAVVLGAGVRAPVDDASPLQTTATEAAVDDEAAPPPPPAFAGHLAAASAQRDVSSWSSPSIAGPTIEEARDASTPLVTAAPTRTRTRKRAACPADGVVECGVWNFAGGGRMVFHDQYPAPDRGALRACRAQLDQCCAREAYCWAVLACEGGPERRYAEYLNESCEDRN